MDDQLDQELVAIGKIVQALGHFDREDRRRILDYVSTRLRVDRHTVDIDELTQNLTDGLQAINAAAAKLREGGEAVSGLRLANVVGRMYEEATKETVDQEGKEG